MNILRGLILTPQGLISGEIHFQKTIKKIVPKKIRQTSKLPIIIPGFIDLHLHGGGGRDFMEAGDAILTIAATHGAHGTTSFLATTVTANENELTDALSALKRHQQVKKIRGSKVLGIHLEGPYLDENKLGAQENKVRPIAQKEIQRLHNIFPLKIITLAVEKLTDEKFAPWLKKMGIVLQLGHSSCTYEQGLAAFKKGVGSFTHLFNAMANFHHRAPGLAGVALAHGEYSELIADLLHVHPGAIKTALRAIPKLYFVTDATAASGMPDGTYQLGHQTVHRCQGGVRLKDGTLAGSCLTMDEVFKNALALGLSVAEASRRCSLFPAQLIKEKRRGQLVVGNYADLLVLSEFNLNPKKPNDFILEKVFVEGESV